MRKSYDKHIDDLIDAMFGPERFEPDPLEDDEPHHVYVYPLYFSIDCMAFLVFVQDREHPCDYHVYLLRGIYE
jgi:hypothetical protein